MSRQRVAALAAALALLLLPPLAAACAISCAGNNMEAASSATEGCPEHDRQNRSDGCAPHSGTCAAGTIVQAARVPEGGPSLTPSTVVAAMAEEAIPASARSLLVRAAFQRVRARSALARLPLRL
jgi:hypothetical protein